MALGPCFRSALGLSFALGAAGACTAPSSESNAGTTGSASEPTATGASASSDAPALASSSAASTSTAPTGSSPPSVVSPEPQPMNTDSKPEPMLPASQEPTQSQGPMPAPPTPSADQPKPGQSGPADTSAMDASVPTGEPATPSGSSSSTGNTPFSFFAFGDAHAGQDATTDQTLMTAAEQMAALDPSAALAFSNGDLVEDSADGPWKTHDQAMQAGNFDATLTSLGTGTPYFAAMDNHDRGFPTERMDWLDQWTRHLPGQQALGHTAKDGVYYSFSYAGVLFIVLDSIHPSQAQNDWLVSVLEGPDAAAARVKLAFFHEPVYSCITDHPPFADGLPWVDTFETHGVKLVFVSHEHTYNRTCAMYHGACSEDAKAVVYQELGPLGAQNFRPTASGPFTASGKDASGAARSDTYSCTGDGSILLTNRDNINDFCHVSVDDCNVHGDCYIVGTNEAFDSWDVKACP